MIRIMGGQFRGRVLHVPKGKDVRPTTSRVRESLFSILTPHLEDAQMLDLFSGSGVVGFEALSRGAQSVVMVESSPIQLKALERNKETLKLSDTECRLIQADVFEWVKRLGDRPQFDLIFMDPPYDKEGISFVLRHVAPVLAPSGTLVWECRSGQKALDVPGLLLTDQREYGETTLLFFERSEASEGS